MGQSLQAPDDRRFAPVHHPGLPPGISKWNALRLVRELRRELKLPRSACEALDKIAAMTAEADWTDPSRLPLCWRRQIDMAEELGLTPRQFRSIEHRLEKAGLIERRVTANGWRGRAGGSADCIGISGLSLAPLIRRMNALMQLAAQVAAERQKAAALRIELRVAWRQLSRRLEAAGPNLQEEAALLAPPRNETLYRMASEALRSLLTGIEAMMGRVSQEASDTGKTSGAPEPKCRCHTKDTIKLKTNPCSATAHRQSICEPARPKTVSKPEGSDGGLRKKHRAAPERVKARPDDRLDLPLLRRIASPEIGFYLDGLACRHLEDAERAVTFRLPELGIDQTAYEAAQERMGWRKALLAVVVIDRNRDHPVTPIRNPGGALRALTRRHEQGALDLMASVWGILGRKREAVS